MKVRIGGSTFGEQSAAEKRFQATLFSAIKKQAIYVGKPYVERLANMLRDVATTEAEKLFLILAEIIDTPFNTSLKAADLSEGMLSSLRGFGSVAWKPDLSFQYLKQKRRQYPESYHNMFKFRGFMYADFRLFGASIVHNKLGGVNIDVNTDQLPGTTIRSESAKRVAVGGDIGDDTNLEKFLLGRMSIHIFPNIEASLLPGLASNRWTQTLADPEFEDSLFGGTSTGYKLAQHHKDFSYYRPLVAPAIQFWILIRLPALIRQRLQSYLGRASIKWDDSGDEPL